MGRIILSNLNLTHVNPPHPDDVLIATFQALFLTLNKAIRSVNRNFNFNPKLECFVGKEDILCCVDSLGNSLVHMAACGTSAVLLDRILQLTSKEKLRAIWQREGGPTPAHVLIA